MAARQPCKSCPWRIEGAPASGIPGFSLELAEGLRNTCDGRFGNPIFACHQSRDGAEIVCAGWLAVYGWHSIAIRLKLAAETMRGEDIGPEEGWPALHPTFDDMIEKLRRTV